MSELAIEEPKKAGRPPKVKEDVTKINLTSLPGKQITKDARGYHFENITFGYNVPLTVLATAVAERLNANTKNPKAAETFRIAKARLNQLIVDRVEPKHESKNGVISYSGDVFSNHPVAVEVYLRVILDGLKGRPEVVKAFDSKDREYIMQKVVDSIKEL